MTYNGVNLLVKKTISILIVPSENKDLTSVQQVVLGCARLGLNS